MWIGTGSSVPEGVRWFHTGGIFAGLSDTTADVVLEAMEAARGHGVKVSSTPTSAPPSGRHGRRRPGSEVNRAIVNRVDVLVVHQFETDARPTCSLATRRTTQPR